MRKSTILIIGSLAVSACRSTVPPDSKPADKPPLTSGASTASSTGTSPTELTWVIEEDKHQPNAILVVEVSIPHLVQRQVYRLPLRRWQAPTGHVPLRVSHGEAADGWVGEEGGTGYVGDVNLVDTTGDTVILEVSFAGKGHDLREVDLTQRISIDWGQEFEGTLDGGGRIHAQFKRPGM